MTSQVKSALTSDEIEKLEAMANGELDFNTEDTQVFFNHPQKGTRIRTPNGSTIQVSRVLMPQCNESELWVMAVGEVLEAPQCPHYKGSTVTFLVNQDGSLCFLEEH